MSHDSDDRDPPPRPLPQVSIHSGDVDEAREFGTRIYHRHRVKVLGEATQFAMSLEAAALGPLTIGWLTYSTEVRLESAHEGHYQVNIPTSGVMRTVHEGVEAVTHGGVAATVHVPDREVSFTGWTRAEPMLALRIPRPVLELELEQLLDRPFRQMIDFDLVLDVAAGRGAQWLALVRALAADLADKDSLARQPLIATPLTRSIVSGLLMSAIHPYRRDLAAPVAAASSSVVRAAKAFIEAHAHEPLTVADIALAAGVGVRAVQQGFQRSLEMSPIEYLRAVRLREVHRELRQADPADTTVGEVAARWGFGHQGRFAAHYRQRYGVSPGITLRRP